MSTDTSPAVPDRGRPADEAGWGWGRILGTCLLAAVLCVVAALAFVAWLKRPTNVNEARTLSDIRVISARPVARGKTGYRSFFADQTGVIRATDEDRPASAGDPPIQ